MTTYTGNLTTFRRDTLLSIHTALSLPYPPGRLTKYALAESIRAELKCNPSAREDPRFEDLWRHMPESRMAPEELERHLSQGGAVDLSEGQTERVREGSVASAGGGSRGASPRKSLGELYGREGTAGEAAGREDSDEPELIPSTYREAIIEGAPHILDSLFHSPRKVAEEAELALVPIERASRGLRRKASVHFRETVRTGTELVGEAQERLSSAWVVVIGVIVAELIWVVWESVPWVDKAFGPLPYLFLPFAPLHFTLHLPVLSVLFHPTFFSALFLWGIGTIALPLLISTILAFPSSSLRSSSSSSGSNAQPVLERGQRLLPAALSSSSPSLRRSSSPSKHSHSSSSPSHTPLSPPNPLIFTLTRLSLSLLRGFVLSPTSPVSATETAFTHLRLALKEIAAGGPGALGLAGGRYRFEGAVEGYWGVMSVGMASASAVVAYAESRRRS
ncbi:hypothetical protein JCM8547_001561 [Rhodosporidiobolus lusitaniae]